MNFQRAKNFDTAHYRSMFGNTDSHQFSVYDNREQKIGQVVDFLVDETGRSYYLAVALENGNRQVLIPESNFLVDRNQQRIYVGELDSQTLDSQTLDSQTLERSSFRTDNQAQGTSQPNGYVIEQYQSQVTDMLPVEASAQLETSAPLDAPRTLTPIANGSHHTVPSDAVPPTPVTPVPVDTVDTSVDPAIASIPVIPTPVVPVVIPASQPEPVAQVDPVVPVEVPATVPPALPIASHYTDQATVQLLEERVVVDRHRRKIGEVIVRKEIETEIVEVPIRREKLIVEQVNPERKQLIAVDYRENGWSDAELQAEAQAIATANRSSGIAQSNAQSGARSIVTGRFHSISAALEFLQAIAHQSESGDRSINDQKIDQRIDQKIDQKIEIAIETSDQALQATYQRLLAQYTN